MTGSGTDEVSGHQSHDAAKFSTVIDGRKQPIRGLWIRGDRYYAQLTVEDPSTGVKQVRRVPLLDKDGKPATTTAQAVAILERLKVSRADGDMPTVHRCPKFSDYVTTYLDFIKAGSGTKKSSTIGKDTATLAGWAKHLGAMRLDQIKPAHVNGYIKKRLTDGMKPRTCNIDVIALRCCLKHARQDGWIQKLPTDGLKPLKVITPKRPFFGVAELDAICKSAMSTRTNAAGETVPVTKNGAQFVDYIRLLSYCGARRKEALALKWQDVNFAGKLLTIGNDGDTKNSQSRTVNFNAKLEAHLLAMKSRKAPDSDFLFPSPQRGERNLSVKTFKESLGLVRTHAKLPRFTFHDCRHHFISLCVMAGIDFMTIAEWAGHQDGGILIGKVYGHLASEHRQAMADKLSFEPVVLIKQGAA